MRLHTVTVTAFPGHVAVICFYGQYLSQGYSQGKIPLLYNLLWLLTILLFPRYPLLHSISGKPDFYFIRGSQSLRWRANRLPLWQHICFIMITEKYKPVKIQKTHFCKYRNALKSFYFPFTINDTDGWLMLNSLPKNTCDKVCSWYKR